MFRYLISKNSVLAYQLQKRSRRPELQRSRYTEPLEVNTLLPGWIQHGPNTDRTRTRWNLGVKLSFQTILSLLDPFYVLFLLFLIFCLLVEFLQLVKGSGRDVLGRTVWLRPTSTFLFWSPDFHSFGWLILVLSVNKVLFQLNQPVGMTSSLYVASHKVEQTVLMLP